MTWHLKRLCHDIGRKRVRWLDTVFIERLWRSLKYECIYLHAFETGSELKAGLVAWIRTTTYSGLIQHGWTHA